MTLMLLPAPIFRGMNTYKNWNTDDTDVTDGHRFILDKAPSKDKKVCDDTDVSDKHRFI